MESCKPFSPSIKSMDDTGNQQNPNPVKPNSGSTENLTVKPLNASIGFLDVFIHEARDIHNICIYHKQDVYAKFSLTADPESSVSTQIINGGGRNPVFNQSVRLDVRTIDSSLKCEIWMLSRVRNYLEDQLLGLALVPLSDVVVANDKLVQEFSLSSTDLYHSPAGFVQLSISYMGSSPEVLAISPSPKASSGLEIDERDCVEGDLQKIEFPDLNVMNENNMMVSEYFGIPCTNLDSGCSEEECDVCPDNEAGVRVVESFGTASNPESNGVTSESTNGDLEKKESNTAGDTESSSATVENEFVPPVIEGDTESSSATVENEFVPPVININIEKEQTVIQQDIVDMYMKSMQQFTESLAKMKIPMDIENGNNNSPTTTADSGESKKSGSRVFYGSRAFF